MWANLTNKDYSFINSTVRGDTKTINKRYRGIKAVTGSSILAYYSALS